MRSRTALHAQVRDPAHQRVGHRVHGPLRGLLALALLALITAGSPALALELQGEPVQGGLIFGSTEPGSTVTLDGRALLVSGEGRFVFGFGRDDTGSVTLEVRPPDDAPVTIVEYASYTCPHCAAFHSRNWEKLNAEYIQTGKVLVEPEIITQSTTVSWLLKSKISMPQTRVSLSFVAHALKLFVLDS